MIAEKGEHLREAAESLYALNSDETIRAQCRARDDYYRMQDGVKRKMERLSEENERLLSEKAEISAENEYMKKLLAESGIPYESFSNEK